MRNTFDHKAMNATSRNALIVAATLAALATSLGADAAAVPGTCDILNNVYCSNPLGMLKAMLQNLLR